MSYIAWYASGIVGGPDKVLAVAAERDWFRILPEPTVRKLDVLHCFSDHDDAGFDPTSRRFFSV